MKKYVWVIVALVVVLVLGIAFFSMNTSVFSPGKKELSVGTDAAYPPFESIDKDGNFIGFDMELIKMVADELGMELKVQSVSWDGIIPGLMNGNYDCLISAMTITAERKKQINFSTPYFSIKQAIVVKEDDTTTKGPEDLIGKTIAVQNGTTGDLFASKIKDVKMKRFDTNPQAVQELLNNNANAAVMDDLVAFDAIKNSKGLKVIEIASAEQEDYGIGVKKGNDKLLEDINKAIETLQGNGKLNELIAKYKSGN